MPLIDPGYRYTYARKLRRTVLSGEFTIVATEEYENEWGQPGVEYICEYRGRRFYCSESRTELPSTLQHFAKVLSDQNDISTKVPLIWPNRFGLECLYLEVWCYGRWYKFHTPMSVDSPQDEFKQLILEVMGLNS